MKQVDPSFFKKARIFLSERLQASLRELDSLCYGCNKDTEKINEIFLVEDDVWEKASAVFPVPENSSLCVGCIEARLKRKLNQSDFKKSPVNNPELPMSYRLRNRLTRTASQ